MSLSLATAIVQIRADSSRLGPDLARARGVAQSGAARVQATTGAIFNQVLGFASVTAAISAFSSGIRTAIGFQDKMTQSLAIMGDVTDEQRGRMEALARSLAVQFGRSASDMAESYFFLASAGLDVEQQLAALPAVTEFATAGAFGLAKATDLLTDAQSALGLSSDDAQQNLANMVSLSDQLVMANTLANGKVEEFSEALTNKAAVAMRRFGIETEVGLAALAAFADQGTKGKRAGEALNIVLRDLTRFGHENAAAFESMGVKVFEGGELRNLADIIADLEVAFAGLSDEQKVAAVSQLGFTAESQAFIMSLVGMSDKMKEYEAGLRQAGGTTAKVAAEQMKSLRVQIAQMRAVMADIAISVLPAFVQGFIDVLAPVRAAAQAFVFLNDATGGMLGDLILATGTAALLMGVVPRLAAAVKVLFDVIKFGMTTTGVGLLLVSLSTGIFVLMQFSDQLKALFSSEQFAPFANAFSKIWETIKTAFRENPLASVVMAIAALNPVFAGVAVVAVGAWNAIKDTVGSVMEAIGAAWERNAERVQLIILRVQEIVTRVFAAVSAVIGAVGDFMAGVFQRVFGTQFSEAVTTGLGGAIDSIVGFVLNASEWVLAFMDNWRVAFDALPSIGLLAVMGLVDVMFFLRDAIPQLIGFGLRKALELFVWFVDQAFKLIVALFEGLAGFLAQLPSMFQKFMESGEGLNFGEFVGNTFANALATPLAQATAFARGLGGEAMPEFQVSDTTLRQADIVAGKLKPIFDAKAELEKGRGGLLAPAGAGGPVAPGAEGGPRIEGRKVEFKLDSGFYDFEGLSKKIQEQFLAGGEDDKQQQMIDLEQQNLEIQKKQLEVQEKWTAKRVDVGLAADEEAP